ncbi:MAG: hypothetical protein QNK04_17370 [Myxococcota bacterium]|nr:hypothetical protein [Myxococcota bacterium]
MSRCLAVAILALLSASVGAAEPPPAPNPLLGSWKSDRELTLERLEVDRLPPERKEEVRTEGNFGEALVEFHADEYVWTLGSQRRRLPYRILAVEGGYVEIEYFRHRVETRPTRMRLFVAGDFLYTPIAGYGFYEVFRRVRPAAKAPE